MPSKYDVTSVTVGVRCKRGTSNFGSEENYTSFTFSKQGGGPFTEGEAELAAIEVSEILKRKIMLDEVAQGLRSPGDFKNSMMNVSTSYKKIRTQILSEDKKDPPNG